MARLLKQRYTAKDGQGRKVTRKSKKWYVEYRDGQGIRRRVPGFTDKAATQQFASELERNAQREQSGLVDRFAEYRKRPLAEHLADYARHLESTASSKTHVSTVIPRIRKVLDGCRFRFWPDVSGAKVQAFVSAAKVRSEYSDL